MLYPLYEFYNKSTMNLYDVRSHYVEHFYYQKYSRNVARKILTSVLSSTKIGKLLQESYARGVAPTCEDFLTTISSMYKFVFKSKDTIVLATIEAALRWDIEVNAKLHLLPSDELKKEMVKVFAKYQVYKEMLDTDFHSVVTPTVDMETIEPKALPNKTSWTLVAFTKTFGKMKVAEFANKETGDKFKSCVFTKGNAKTFVYFSSKLGELTPEEIEEQKNDLLIVKSKSGKYNLVKARKNTWQDVDI